MKISYSTLLAVITLVALMIFTSCEEKAPIKPDGQVTLELAGIAPPDEGARTKDGHFVPECQDPGIVAAVAINIDGFDYTLTPQWFPGLGKWQVVMPVNVPGIYTVNSLGLLNGDNELIYATPQNGSPFAPLVNKPVPFDFEVKNGEKLFNDADVVCYWPSITPEFGVKLLEWEECFVFKNWWFANYCTDEYGHEEGDIKGGIYFPELERIVHGQFDEEYGFFYTYSKYCEYDYQSYVYLILCITGQKTGESKYFRIPVPLWLLKYQKYYVTHLLVDCYPNICRATGAQQIAADLGIGEFNEDEWDGNEISSEEFDKYMAQTE